MLTVDLWLQLAVLERRSYSRSNGLRLVTCTVEPPEHREPHTILTRITVKVPWQAFRPLIAEAVEVPLEAIERPVVEAGQP